MEEWRTADNSRKARLSNGKSNGVAIKSRKDSNSSDYSQTLQCNRSTEVRDSPVFSSKSNTDKVTCALVVTVHKDGTDHTSLSKSFVFDTFNLGKLSIADIEGLEFKKISFDLKMQEPKGERRLREGINEDENGNAYKPRSYSNLHFDWSRFEVLPMSLGFSKFGQFKKYMPFLFVLLLAVVVGVFLSFEGTGFFYSFIENICKEYKKEPVEEL